MKFLKPQPGQHFACWFHWKLDAIENAYKASRTFSESALAENRRRIDVMQRAVDAGKASWAGEDEEGNVDYSYAESFGEEEAQQDDALGHIRFAFLIALFHFWEQSLAKELPRHKHGGFQYDAELAFEWLESFKWTPLRDELLELQLIANCAKHSEGVSAERLYVLRPDFFDRDAIEKSELRPGYSLLLISDNHVAGYFKAVRSSVPRMPLII